MKYNTCVKILIYNRTQFGYHIDTYKYVEELGDEIQFVYACIDQGRPKIDSSKAQIAYVTSNKVSKVKRIWHLFAFLIKERRNFDAFFAVYHPGISIISPLLRSRMILDIRSRNVSEFWLTFRIQNWILKLEAKTARHVTVVSKELAASLGLDEFTIIPVGVDNVSPTALESKNEIPPLILTYLGSFEQRNIPLLVQGFSFACRKSSHQLKLFLAGTGPEEELDKIHRSIQEACCPKSIELTGYLNRGNIDLLLRRTHVGIVHIPADGRYDGQPSTKLFEYWSYGIPVIGSRYDYNEKYIDSNSGFLYEFDSQDLCKVILEMLESYHAFHAADIALKSKSHLWSAIVRNNLLPLLNKVG
jgi:glycosyltransferase involved in cell wall biosynthesis